MFRDNGLTVAVRQAGDDHVSVADGLHFVDVVAFDARVEHFVESVEECDDFDGRGTGRDLREADNVRKVNGHRLESFGWHLSATV